MANEKKLTTMGQMQTFAQRQDARDDAQDEQIKNHAHKKLSITGAAVGTYDGSADVSINIPTIAGEPGPQGEKGETGAAGADGKSAYEYAQDGGYTGTEAEFTAKLAQMAGEAPSAITNEDIDAIFDAS